jgi:Ni/Fe-hydrogenase subunit HybB-like protein
MLTGVSDSPDVPRLDQRRIRRIIALRRAERRAGMMALLAAWLAGLLGAQAVWIAVRRMVNGAWDGRTILAGAVAVGLTVACVAAFRLARRLRAVAPETPITRGQKPDFGPLQNGSQFARNLDEWSRGD